MPKTTQYIWESSDWPTFSWDNAVLLTPLSECRLLQGQLMSKMSSLGFPLEQEAQSEILFEETITTSAIEGESLNRNSVRSSIAKKLGLPYQGIQHDRHVDGLIEVLIDATKNYSEPLTCERLFSWHAALFPTGYSGLQKINVGSWRGVEPMRVVSIEKGRETIHYEAPPFERVANEMKQFIDWWENSSASLEGILRAAIAHFYFVSIHPFEDGNGRIARALTDMALAQDDKQQMRYYSLSSQILAERNDYYKTLENSQKRTIDITAWLQWFLGCYARAIRSSEKKLTFILEKSNFWYRHSGTSISERQRKVINKLLDAGRNNFSGGLTNRKYCAIAKVSKATAAREIKDLLDKNILKQNPGKGRSVSYDLMWE